MNAPMGTAAPVRSLEPRYYLDPACYEAERVGLFRRTWIYAAHESEVAEPGDYVTLDLSGDGVFLVRGSDGLVRAFHNVCRHRAHELVSGTGNAKRIVCPYHSWGYELDGRLRSGPNLRAASVGEVRLSELRVEDFHGFLFVNADRDAAPMDDWFPGAREEIGAFVPHIRELRSLEWVEIPERCNWKVSVENYSECYHCQINHPTFSSGVIRPQTYDIQPQGHCLRHTTECADLDRMSYGIDSTLPYAGEYSSWFLWPTFSFQVYPGNVLNTYVWRPHGHDRTTVWRGWYTRGGVDDETVRRLAVQDRATTVEEDIHLVESVQRGLASPGYEPGPLVIDPSGSGVMSEHSIAALHEWMRAAHDEAAS